MRRRPESPLPSAGSLQVQVQRCNWVAAPLSSFGVGLQNNGLKKCPLRLQSFARTWVRSPTNCPGIVQEDVAALLLLDLGLALWSEQVWRWQRQRKAWTSKAKIVSCIGWYLMGQRVGQKPVFDGICARCGDLLFGALGEGGSYKMKGSPCDINDEEAIHTAQPPFLLRWSPAFFAQKLPDVFAWDSSTNKVLQEPSIHPHPLKCRGLGPIEFVELIGVHLGRGHPCCIFEQEEHFLFGIRR